MPYVNSTAFYRIEYDPETCRSFGSQTRRILEGRERELRLRALVGRLAERLPPDARDDPEVASILAEAGAGGGSSAAVLCLGYRAAPNEAGPGKMFDFSPPTIADRWEAGARGMREAPRVAGASEASVPAATAAGLVAHEIRG